MDEWDEVKYVCNGTPLEFLYIVMVGGTDDENEIDYGAAPDRYHVSVRIHLEKGYAIFRAQKDAANEDFRLSDLKAECKITATPLLENSSKTLLRVSMIQGEWLHVEQLVMSLLRLAEAERWLEGQTTGPTPIKRGRKSISPEDQNQIVAYYLENQTEMGLEAVGGKFGVSGKTVQRYVKKNMRTES